jgi:hypothetical protein
MITFVDLGLGTIAAFGGSAIGAIIIPKRYLQIFSRGTGLRYPRFWSVIFTATLALPLLVGVKDAGSGGSLVPWIVAYVVLSVIWITAFWLKGNR